MSEEQTSEKIVDKISLKEERQQHLHKQLTTELQGLLTEAAHIQKNITDAKTSTKKSYYQKKFDKSKGFIKQYVNVIQHLEATIGQQKDLNNDIITTVAE